MFKLLICELCYIKNKLILLYSVSIICFLLIWFAVKYDSNRAPLILLMMMVPALIIGLLFYKDQLVDKKERIYLLLAISSKNIALMRILLPLCLWIIMLVLFFITWSITLSVSGYNLLIPSANQFFFINGPIIILYTTYLIYIDLKYRGETKTGSYFMLGLWLILYITSLAPMFILINFFGLFGTDTALQQALSALSQSSLFSVALNIIAILLIYFSLQIFTKKKSYLQN